MFYIHFLPAQVQFRHLTYYKLCILKLPIVPNMFLVNSISSSMGYAKGTLNNFDFQIFCPRTNYFREIGPTSIHVSGHAFMQSFFISICYSCRNLSSWNWSKGFGLLYGGCGVDDSIFVSDPKFSSSLTLLPTIISSLAIKQKLEEV